MNEEFRCITNERKSAKNKWENDDSDFLQALYSVYNKLGQFINQTFLLTCLKKNVSSVKSCKYLNKLIS